MTDQLRLTADVCQLHNMVHTALRDALTALLTLDTALAQEVREKEKEIDRTSIRLDEACIAWLNEHPSPPEVSRAVASVKIIADHYKTRSIIIPTLLSALGYGLAWKMLIVL